MQQKDADNPKTKSLSKLRGLTQHTYSRGVGECFGRGEVYSFTMVLPFLLIFKGMQYDPDSYKLVITQRGNLGWSIVAVI